VARHVLTAGLALALCAGSTAWAQQPGGIYTCVDAKGRKLTSDRPIAECADREQKELNTSGTVRRTLPPSLTATELAAKEEQERRAAQELQRQADEKRRERAMLARYPDQASHDLERAKALNAVQEVILAGQKRIVDLQDQRKPLIAETEFYVKDPSKMPPGLRRQLDENAQHVAAQQRFIANQEEEKRRVNKRFDEELARLKVLWAQLKAQPQAVAPPAAAAAAAPAASSVRR
jgi:hypothetical protein